MPHLGCTVFLAAGEESRSELASNELGTQQMRLSVEKIATFASSAIEHGVQAGWDSWVAIIPE